MSVGKQHYLINYNYYICFTLIQDCAVISSYVHDRIALDSHGLAIEISLWKNNFLRDEPISGPECFQKTNCFEPFEVSRNPQGRCLKVTAATKQEPERNVAFCLWYYRTRK